ncbi:hypothetical protein L218DRAFT_1019666 [Marasmius fiardii PR-910]|nr:hypothetical protein L218DRAFT_1019666 [Marasmius fiardii PR-910]
MSNPPSSPAPRTGVEKGKKLKEARDKLLKNKHAVYLASDLAGKLGWKSDSEGRGSGFVVLPEQVKKENRQDAATNGDDDEQVAADLAVIARVSKQDTFFVSDGYWKGKRQYTETLADLKLSVVLEAVNEYEDLQKDFEGCKRTIQRLRELRTTHDIRNCNGVLVKGNKDTEKIKLRYCVFLPKLDPSDNEEETGDVPSGPIPFKAEYTLRGYPLSHKAAQDQRALMVTEKTHKLNVIGVYGVDGKRIPPSRAAGSLRGAIVKAYFTLSHIPISGESKDRFIADLASLRIVVPPPTPPTPSTLRRQAKRKDGKDPFSDSDDEDAVIKQEDLQDPFTEQDEPPTKKQKQF